MKEIDDYLRLIYKHLNATDEEIANSKYEMKNHLLESVRELQAEGKSEQESVRIAIERFGDPYEINRELPKVITISRHRFSGLLMIITGVVLVLVIGFSLVYMDNVKKQGKLDQAELEKQAVIQNLEQSQLNIENYERILMQFNELAVVYNNSDNLSKDLKAKYNISAIDRIGDMNKTFKYHNTVLIAVAVIAAETDYECPYYKDISDLAVMKLSESMDVINLAEKARVAETEEDKEYIRNQINLMKENAEFKTYEEAFDYNNKFK